MHFLLKECFNVFISFFFCFLLMHCCRFKLYHKINNMKLKHVKKNQTTRERYIVSAYVDGIYQIFHLKCSKTRKYYFAIEIISQSTSFDVLWQWLTIWVAQSNKLCSMIRRRKKFIWNVEMVSSARLKNNVETYCILLWQPFSGTYQQSDKSNSFEIPFRIQSVWKSFPKNWKLDKKLASSPFILKIFTIFHCFQFNNLLCIQYVALLVWSSTAAHPAFCGGDDKHEKSTNISPTYVCQQFCNRLIRYLFHFVFLYRFSKIISGYVDMSAAMWKIEMNRE